MNDQAREAKLSAHAAHRMSRRWPLIGMLALCGLSVAANATTNAGSNGQWISIGVPTRINVGSAGFFYLTGNDHGTCASTLPTYFRSDMSKTYWKEFYAMVLFAHANQKPLECLVESACGTTEVWITYCTLPLN
jgi:hypothetical protein